jgi:SnoaL-like domain
MDNLQALAEMLDRDSIRNAVVRLARGEDRRDPDLVSSAFWPDATFDYGVFAGDFPAYLAWVTPGADSIPNTQHILAQTLIELEGATARAETHVVSYHRADFSAATDGSDLHDACIGARYLDQFERRDGEWRIARRVMLYDWIQDWGASADWSQGVMGTPFTGEHFSGRAHGDWSEVFFGKRKG